MLTRILVCLLLAPTVPLLADNKPPDWTQLSLGTCGVDRYHRAHPELDGRGVVIAVLDTGVDMGVAGLTHTPEGEVKVIDVQDFSEQGDVALEDIRFDREAGHFVYHAKDGAPQEYRMAEAANHAPGTRYWFGLFEESRFANSDVPDINDNGRTDDEFGILVLAEPGATDDQAVVYIDTDADRTWSNEQPLQNYHVKHDTFQFARQKKERQITPMTCGLNVNLRDRKVSIHFDDGGHGTHVAGIAAGYRINGQRDFHGVAPGAKIISLKIGDNTLAGGATTTGSKKKAFEYAARYAREHHVPVVCNLSYGIGSEQEGHSDIDVFLDELCRANPNVLVFSSAGNSGPGLSTVGTPAAGSAVITVAALLGADSGRDVMGLDMSAPQVAVFSSRGGELPKPSLAVPGYATSTVPRWNRRGDFWRGTSMASPFAAGMGALMICNADARYPDMQHRNSWVKTALQQSGDPMYGYSPLDYGAGVPDMNRAVEAYRQLASSLQGDVLFDYHIETDSPLASGGKSPAAYWRSAYHPTDRSQVFEVKPRFVPTFDADSVTAFSRRYELRSDADWLLPRQKQVYFRSEQPANVHVDYDSAKLGEPGLYVGVVEGVADGQVGFRLVNTVIVPHRFGPHNQYRVTLSDHTVEGWRVSRHFFDVPPGASAMHLDLRVPDGRFSDMRIREIFKPNGATLSNRSFVLDTHENKNSARWTIAEELQSGVWELCTTSTRPDETSNYDLSVRFSGVRAQPQVVSSWKHKEGRRPTGELTLTQLFDTPLPVKLQGRIEGYEVAFDKEITPKDDVVKREVRFNPDLKAVRVEAEFSERDFARFTDVAITLFNAKGTAIRKGGMNYRQAEMTVGNPDPAADSVTCNLELQGAFADRDPERNAQARLKITYLYKDPIQVTASSDPGTLYPGVPRTVAFELSGTPPQPPDGTHTVGTVEVHNAGSDDLALSVPIRK